MSLINSALALQCAILSQEIYTDFSPELRFSAFPNLVPELLEIITTDTQGAILADFDTDTAYVIFRGSESNTDWITNLNLGQEKVYPYAGESSSGAEIHKGFAAAYFSMRDEILRYFQQSSQQQVIVTGHSLGGALATICAVDLQYNFTGQFGIEVYTYGAPRVGNSGFAESFNRRVPQSYRFVHGMDIVPALPRFWQGYRHVEEEYRLGSRWSLNFISQRFIDHRISGYIEKLKE
jgi:triacylglycerol lipase